MLFVCHMRGDSLVILKCRPCLQILEDSPVSHAWFQMSQCHCSGKQVVKSNWHPIVPQWLPDSFSPHFLEPHYLHMHRWDVFSEEESSSCRGSWASVPLPRVEEWLLKLKCGRKVNDWIQAGAPAGASTLTTHVYMPLSTLSPSPHANHWPTAEMLWCLILHPSWTLKQST